MLGTVKFRVRYLAAFEAWKFIRSSFFGENSAAIIDVAPDGISTTLESFVTFWAFIVMDFFMLLREVTGGEHSVAKRTGNVVVLMF